LIEDCKFSFYALNLNFSGGLPEQNLSLRRNIVIDSWPAGGIFIVGVTGQILLEENVIDHNGWNETVPSYPTVFTQNLYFDTGGDPAGQPITSPVILRRNIISRAAANGANIRNGGNVTNNLWVGNPIAFNVYNTSSVTDNIITEGTDMTGPNAGSRGWGLEVVNFIIGKPLVNAFPQTVINNIIAHETSTAHGGYGISLDGVKCNTGHPQCSLPAKNAVVRNNIICSWDSPIVNQGTQNITTPNVTSSNCSWLTYPDPNRTVGSYNHMLGGLNSSTAFLARARTQSKDNWNPVLTANAVNNYIRAGFGQPPQ
jgi:hypothetical protein